MLEIDDNPLGRYKEALRFEGGSNQSGIIVKVSGRRVLLPRLHLLVQNPEDAFPVRWIVGIEISQRQVSAAAEIPGIRGPDRTSVCASRIGILIGVEACHASGIPGDGISAYELISEKRIVVFLCVFCLNGGLRSQDRAAVLLRLSGGGGIKRIDA